MGNLQAKAYGASGSFFSSLKPMTIERKQPQADGITPEVQLINIRDINDAFDKTQDNEVRYRFVIDMQSLKDQTIED